MKKDFGLVLILFLLGFGGPALAQPLAWSSPRQTGLVGLTAPLGDGFAALLSPSSMGDMDVPQATLSAGRMYGLAGLPVVGAGYSAPVWGAHKAGLGLVRLGTGSLTQTMLAAAYAYNLDKTTLAIQVGYYQLALGEARTAGVPTFSLGGQSKLIPKLTLAGQVSNLTQPKLRTDTQERLAASFRASGIYEASPDLWLMLQTEKVLNRPATLVTGVEYRIHTYIRLRCGAAPWPGYIGAGFRADVWGMQLEYGVAHHGLLGQIHSLGIGWTFIPQKRIEAQAEPAE